MKSLSFVATHDEKSVFWAPERPSNYVDACTLGRTYAAELHGYMYATQDTAVFGAVIRAMMADGNWTGVEAGFCQGFGIVLAGTPPVFQKAA